MKKIFTLFCFVLTIQYASSQVFTITDSIVHVRCNGSCDGEIYINISGGTAPYLFTWPHNPGNNDPFLIGLCAGIDSMRIMDSNGDTAWHVFEILEPDPLDVTMTSTPESCFGNCDAIVDLTISGGTTPYFVNWCTGDTVQDIIGLCAGTCTVDIVDTNGCSLHDSVTIIEPPLLTLSLTGFLPSCSGCNDGTAQAFVSGGTPPYTCVWESMDTTLLYQNLLPAMYHCCVYDSSGCFVCDSINLNPFIGIFDPVRGELESLLVSVTGEQVKTQFILSDATSLSFKMMDVSGRIIRMIPQEKYSAGEHHLFIDISGLSGGLYMLNLEADHVSVSEKIVVYR